MKDNWNLRRLAAKSPPDSTAVCAFATTYFGNTGDSLMSFDPSGRAPSNSGIFGLPYTAEESHVILIPVPWEATTSYGSGTSLGPKAILEASHQVDLFDLEYGRAYESGFHMLEIPKFIQTLSNQTKLHAKSLRKTDDMIFEIESKTKISKVDSKKLEVLSKKRTSLIEKVNQASARVNDYVFETAYSWIKKGKTIALVGGDHSSPLGLMKAISQSLHNDFGILHIDAHHDLRDSYEGFQYSHASILIPNL
jgi:agmatinase